MRKQYIYTFDLNGNVISIINEVENKMAWKTEFDDLIVDDSIMVQANRYGDGTVILDNGEEYQLCSKELKNAIEDEDFVLRAKYKLKYIGEGLFETSRIEIIDTYKSALKENCY